VCTATIKRSPFDLLDILPLGDDVLEDGDGLFAKVDRGRA
jgi:hypothetical protein